MSSVPCPGVLGFPSNGAYFGATQLRVVDFDGDGLDDLVYANSNGIGVRFAVGDGTFDDQFLVTVSNASVFEVADLNDDDAPDIVFHVILGANVFETRVVFNDGHGNVGTPQLLFSGLVGQFAVTDVDGDNDLDIIEIAVNDHIAVVRQDNGVFASPEIFEPLNPPARMAVGDVTGDGRPDVVTDGPTGIRVFANDGSGSFGSAIPYPTTITQQIQLIDVNEDGRLDVVGGASSPNGDHISILLNLGSGVFGTASTLPITGTAPIRLTAGDVDGDGHLDLAGPWNDGLNQGFQIMLGTGTGQFGAPHTFRHRRITNVAFGHWDLDAGLDVVVFGNAIDSIFQNTGDANLYAARSELPLGVDANQQQTARLLDVNDDGRGDLVELINTDTTRTVVWRVVSNGSFQAPVTLDVGLGYSQFEVADLDNDGRGDLVLFGGGRLLSLMNHGNATFTPATQVVFGVVAFLKVGDVDGDGFRDIVVGRVNGATGASEVTYHPGFGNGDFGTATTIWSGNALSAIVVADLDGNSMADVVVEDFDFEGSKQEVFLSTGAGTFDTLPITVATELPASRTAARDLDGDGQLDLLGGNGRKLIAMLGHGDGTFGAAIETTVDSAAFFANGVHGPFGFADFDGDGKLDLATHSGLITVLRGRGDGTFDRARVFECGDSDGPNAFGIGDIDADGRVDLVLAGSLNRIGVLNGRCW